MYRNCIKTFTNETLCNAWMNRNAEHIEVIGIQFEVKKYATHFLVHYREEI